MLKELKFKTADQDIWFTSDLHFNHNPSWDIPIWKERGFNSVEESNKYIISKINGLVKPDDILFSAGDLTLNCSESDFENFIRQLNCKNIYCLWGNHPNPMAKIYKREMSRLFVNSEGNLADYSDKNFIPEIYPFRYKNIIYLGHHVEMWVDKQFIVLNHYPLHIFNYMKHNSWNLCGHSHHKFEKSLPNYLEQKILDIGWDGFLRPLSFQEIKEIMDKKKYIKVDKNH